MHWIMFITYCAISALFLLVRCILKKLKLVELKK